MIFIVEIRNKQGNLARREYKALSYREALSSAEDDLIEYPQWYVNEIWKKDGSTRGFYGTELTN